MPSDNLTPSEGAILIVLLAEAREVSNNELRDRFGLTLTGRSKDKLNGLGYVESKRDGNGPIVHRLGDAGWARCKEPLNFEKVRPLALGAALTLLMAAVQRDLDRTGRSLAMMFAEDGDAPPVTTDLIEQIRLAYKTFAADAGDWVNIADIRETLSSVGRDEMDDALRELEQQRDVNIVPQADENALSERTRRAAVIIGRQHKHFIAIGV
jgi:hypothetical protein